MEEELKQLKAYGPTHELTGYFLDLIKTAEYGLLTGKLTLAAAIATSAQAFILGRGFQVRAPGVVLAAAVHTRTAFGSAEPRNNMIVRIGELHFERKRAEALELCDEALKRWPDDWWIYERRALLKRSIMTLDTISSLDRVLSSSDELEDIAKACAPPEDCVLLWYQTIFTWQDHLAKSSIYQPNIPLDTQLLNPAAPLSHLPIHERVPAQCMKNLHITQKAARDHAHPSLICALRASVSVPSPT